jgi:hypothetical protein
MGASILPVYIIFFIINLVIQIVSGALNPDMLFGDLGSVFGDLGALFGQPSGEMTTM